MQEGLRLMSCDFFVLYRRKIKLPCNPLLFELNRLDMRIIIACLFALFSFCLHAANEQDASKLVKKYSETVACQLNTSDLQENQYKAVMVKPGFEENNGMGRVFVVYWEGDFGCAGGNGTVVPNFTVVEHSGFMSVAPVVKTDYKFPDLDLVRITSISSKNGRLLIKGITYGPKDPQSSPK